MICKRSWKKLRIQVNDGTRQTGAFSTRKSHYMKFFFIQRRRLKANKVVTIIACQKAVIVLVAPVVL